MLEKLTEDSQEAAELLRAVKQDYQEDRRVQVSAEERGKFERMTKWMLDNGAVLSKMKIRWLGPDYRGVIATRDILAGEQFMYVPDKLIVSLDMIKQTPTAKAILATGADVKLDMVNHSILGVYMLEQ